MTNQDKQHNVDLRFVESLPGVGIGLGAGAGVAIGVAVAGGPGIAVGMGLGAALGLLAGSIARTWYRRSPGDR